MKLYFDEALLVITYINDFEKIASNMMWDHSKIIV